MTTNIHKVLEQVTQEAQKALGDNLVSLLLYGSHARGDATQNSDYNLFLVVQDGSASKLEPLTKLVPGWLKNRVTPPVVFEQAQIARSLDTFALEFLEIAASRRVLAGTDPFRDFSPDWQAVRWDIEEEAREKYVALLRRWLASGENEKAMRAIIAETVPGYLPLLRGTLQLQRRSVNPLPTTALFDGSLQWPGFNPNLWKNLWETAKGMQNPSAAALTLLVKDYLEQARLLVMHVDQLPGNEDAR